MPLNTIDSKEYWLRKQGELESLLKKIGSSFTLDEGRNLKISEVYFDTFDWLLYGGDHLLKRRGRRFYLSTREGKPVAEGEAILRKKFFSWDIVDKKFRQILQPLSEIRALVEIVTVNSERKSYNLLNKDRKTVVRLLVDSSTVFAVDSEKKEVILPTVLYLEGVRGYSREFSKVRKIFSDSPVEEMKDATMLDFALSQTGRKALDYSSKFALQLDRKTSVRQAVADICLSLNRAMEVNYTGVLDDIDSEFLHDFRIAIRRTRSLLSQFNKALPDKANMYFQNEFRWLGSITGPVRDIDVYLLMREDFRKILPVELHEGLDFFFEDLANRRKHCLRDMKKDLTSERYSQLMAEWKTFLSVENEGEEWPGGGGLCVRLAVKKMRKRFSRIIRDGKEIDDDSPDELLHRLRIQGKKLRYLLEFFRSFFPEGDIEFFLKQLKKLQNNLGDFNDVSVQQTMLISRQKELRGGSRRSVIIAASIGGLLAHLGTEHDRIRRKFESTFNAFAQDNNIERFMLMLQQ